MALCYCRSYTNFDAQSLQWPKSPAITFKDHLSFQSQDDIDNLESSDSLLESSRCVQDHVGDSQKATLVGATDTSSKFKSNSVTETVNLGKESKRSRKNLRVIVPTDENPDKVPKLRSSSSDKNGVRKSKKSAMHDLEASNDPASAQQMNELVFLNDHGAEHPDSAHRRKERLSRHSTRFLSPDMHQERSVNALTLSPFGTPGASEKRRRSSFRSNVSIGSEIKLDDRDKSLQNLDMGAKTTTAFESSQQKAHFAGAKSRKDSALNVNSKKTKNMMSRNEALQDQFDLSTPPRAPDGDDLGATFPLGTPGVVPVSLRKTKRILA